MMNEWGWILTIESLVVAFGGSALHFAYEWSHKNKLVGVFAAVNESTWEHVKLALSGIFVCMLVDVWFLGDNPNYWLARSLSFVVPVVLIPSIFYSYTKYTGRAVLPVDIITFFLAAFVATLVFVWVLQWPAVGLVGGIVSGAVGVIIMVLYLLLTKFPPHDFLFRDPITKKYGYGAFRPLFGKKKKRKTKKK